MRTYLDSSVVAGWLLSEPNRLPDQSTFNAAISSELIRVEIARVLRRHFAEERLTPRDLNRLFEIAELWFAQMDLVPIFPALLQRASGHFPTVIGTLDAIHLATAQLWEEDTGERLRFLTRDRQLLATSLACGFSTSLP
jgi:predicted nucleic acid-binding protein